MPARGTIVIASAGGGLRGKPRPAIVVQASDFDFVETLIVVPLTSRELDDNAAMPLLIPDGQNGLEEDSRAMLHRIGAIRKSDVGVEVGTLSSNDMARVDAALSLVLGLNAA